MVMAHSNGRSCGRDSEPGRDRPQATRRLDRRPFRPSSDGRRRVAAGVRLVAARQAGRFDTRAGGAAAAPSGALTALTQAPLGIAIFDREMRYLAASQQYLTDQGLPGDTPLLGRVHYDVFPQVPQKWRDGHARAIALGVELSHEAD